MEGHGKPFVHTFSGIVRVVLSFKFWPFKMVIVIAGLEKAIHDKSMDLMFLLVENWYCENNQEDISFSVKCFETDEMVGKDPAAGRDCDFFQWRSNCYHRAAGLLQFLPHNEYLLRKLGGIHPFEG
jgi:hypothetical protein